MKRTLFFVGAALASAQVPGTDCTKADIAAAARTCGIPQACEAGVKPSITDKCCASCMPSITPGDKDKPSGIPTGCTKEIFAACEPPACEEGERPKLSECCATCYVKKPDTCTEESKEKCKEAMSEKPVCDKPAKDMSFSDYFDKETCCPTCKRSEKAKDPKKCTRDAFKTCVMDTRKCEDGEKPGFDGECCKSCIRREAAKKFHEIAKCASAPTCQEDEEPVIPDAAVDSEDLACACKPAKPKCASPCSGKQVCVRKGKKEATKEAKCVGKIIRKFKIKAKDELAEAMAGNGTTVEDRAEFVCKVLGEMVNRYCDKPENDGECELYKQTLQDGMTCKVIKNFNIDGDEADGEVEVDVPEAESRRLRRLLADSSPSTLLENAVNDADDEEVTVTADGSSSPEKSDESGASQAAVAWLGAAALAIGSLLVM